MRGIGGGRGDPNPSGRVGLVRIHSGTRVPDRFTDPFDLVRRSETNVELGCGWSYRQDDQADRTGEPIGVAPSQEDR